MAPTTSTPARRSTRIAKAKGEPSPPEFNAGSAAAAASATAGPSQAPRGGIRKRRAGRGRTLAPARPQSPTARMTNLDPLADQGHQRITKTV
ncbi:MAG: hypothetical protein Q9191_007127, partial [Dirinaria sp. TL-2023a]